MPKEIILNCTEYETRIAILEDHALSNFYVERIDERSIAGNIYMGKVVRVLPGMQAAFVDIGLERSAFLYVADTYNEVPDLNFFTNGDDPIEYEKGEHPEPYSQPIEDILREGQEILVQVSKDPLGSKGSRVTTHISLAGRNIVSMPTSYHTGISKKITDEQERDRLREIIEKLRPERHGFIARTASEGKQEDELKGDFDYLFKLWNTIKQKVEHTAAPGLVHRELNMTLRAIRDLYKEDVERIVIDSEEEYRKAIDFMDSYMPFMKYSIDLYRDNIPIFDSFGIELDISRMLNKKVWLKSGGYIIIEETEALCSIDVNTGKYVGKKNIEETILKTNMEAVREIAYQLRIRNIGGIIIIDFIDMETEANREKIFEAFKAEMEKDRNKTNVQKISEFGLIEMTRQRRRKSLSGTMCEACPYCSGRGSVKSRASVCYEIFRELEREAAYDIAETLCVLVHPDVAKLLLENENDTLKNLEKRLGRKILVETDNSFHQENFEIIPMRSN
ncbi:MAG: Rne/Rng family ribonuclease [Deltaproteobacteria bacterium]|nr:Rne/Rng family ribonuclease [Deltaproteobacteria bacterium]